MPRLLTVAAMLATLVVTAMPAKPALAQSSLQNRIEHALTPRTEPGQPVTRSLGATRSLSANPTAAAERQGIERQGIERQVIERQVIERARTRAISIEAVQPAGKDERDQIASLVRDKPRIDLEIYFDYNSDVIGPKAIPAVNALGAVLVKPGFKGGVFILNGHTDAAGSAEYNLGLSHRRAQSVRRYLIERFGLAPEALLVAGYGKERLKFSDRPLADENRRVEVVNATR